MLFTLQAPWQLFSKSKPWNPWLSPNARKPNSAATINFQETKFFKSNLCVALKSHPFKCNLYYNPHDNSFQSPSLEIPDCLALAHHINTSEQIRQLCPTSREAFGVWNWQPSTIKLPGQSEGGLVLLLVALRFIFINLETTEVENMKFELTCYYEKQIIS